MRLLLIISFILCSLFSFAQPGGYTEGTFVNWSFNSRDHGFFKADGFDAAASTKKRVLVHFEGDGETNSAGLTTQAPGKYLNDAGTNWNGKVALSAGDTIYFVVVTIFNTNGNFPTAYKADIEYAFANTTNLPDTSVHNYYAISAFSGGCNRMWETMITSGFAYANVFGLSRSISTPFQASDYTAISANRRNTVWRNSDDANGGTPVSASDNLYDDLSGTKDKKYPTTSAGHSADSAMSIYGADSSTNYWKLISLYTTSGGGGGGGGGGTISTNKVRVNNRMVKNMRLIYGKDLYKLFDGDVHTDMTVTDENPGAQGIPDEQWAVFDSVYKNCAFRYWDSNGTASVYVTVYNKNLDSLYCDTLNTSGFLVWHTDTTGFNSKDSIWALRFVFPTFDSYTQATSEFEFYGDAQGVAPNIWRTSLRTYNDPGKYGFGIGQLDDRDMSYVRKVGNSMRLIYANVRSNNADDSALALNQFGFRSDNGGVTNKLNVEALNAAQSYGMHVTVTPTGGSIKNLVPGTIKPYNYGTWTRIFDSTKYITPGADSTQYSAWTGLGHNAAMWAYLYGNSTSATRSYNFYGGNSTQGQNKITNLSNYNEWSKTWKGVTGHHDAYVYYASQKVFYDSVKAIDPNLPVYMGALIMMEDFFPIAFNWVHYLKTRNATDFPADGWDFNTYLNSKYAGQFFDGADSAITPERWRVYDRLISTRNINDSAYGRLRIQWTENGFDTAAASPFRVTTLPGKSKQEVKADLTARTYAIAQAVPYGVEALYYYWFETDFTYIFGGMAAAIANYDGGGAYVNTTFYPVGNLLWQQKDIEEFYPWWSTVVTNGDSTGVWVTRKTHNTLNKKIFKVWKGTYNGSTASHTIDFGSGVTSVNKITWDYNSGVPTTTAVTLSGNSYTDTITEKLVWYEATYSTPVNGFILRKGKKRFR